MCGGGGGGGGGRANIWPGREWTLGRSLHWRLILQAKAVANQYQSINQSWCIVKDYIISFMDALGIIQSSTCLGNIFHCLSLFHFIL